MAFRRDGMQNRILNGAPRARRKLRVAGLRRSEKLIVNPARGENTPKEARRYCGVITLRAGCGMV
jgi:hypothetical protein